jgi:hypothetical protein
MRRPPIISLLAILQFIGAVAWIVIALGISALPAALGMDAEPSGLLSLLLVAQAVLQIACGLGLWKLRPYGRRLQILFAVIGLLAFPIGTIVSILILYYLFRPGIKLLFSGRTADEFRPEESAQVAAVSGGSMATIVVVIGIAVALIVVAGVAASMAVPALLRARTAGNEASAMASLRAINSGQMAFASLCGEGFFAPSLASLATPPPGGQDAFVGDDLAGDPTVKSGYRIALVPGEPAPDAPAGCNGAAVVSSYFVSAEPETEGATGTRYFATNAEGMIYQAPAPIAVTQTGAPPNAAPIMR